MAFASIHEIVTDYYKMAIRSLLVWKYGKISEAARFLMMC